LRWRSISARRRRGSVSITSALREKASRNPRRAKGGAKSARAEAGSPATHRERDRPIRVPLFPAASAVRLR
jgi:hypothetical protein